MLAIHTGAAAAPYGHDDRKEKRHEEPVSDKGRLKISGYLQPQFQWGEGDASLKVGTPNDNPSKSFNRLGLRRGHLKFAYAYKTASAVVQIDVSTEKGVILKDAYIDVKEPWLRTFGLQAGVFNRPFGLEIELSSSVRETPERSYIFPMLFPDERDFGAMLVIRAPEDSPWHIVGLQAGIFSGNGIGQDNDNRKDFIGHLSFGDEFDDFSFRAGASYYHGFVYQGTGTVHTMTDSGFRTETDPSNKGRYAKRQYYGFDACFRFETDLGTTTLRGEYLFGTQPGTQTSSKSPNTAGTARIGHLPASVPGRLRPSRPRHRGYALLAGSQIRRLRPQYESIGQCASARRDGHHRRTAMGHRLRRHMAHYERTEAHCLLRHRAQRDEHGTRRFRRRPEGRHVHPPPAIQILKHGKISFTGT